MFVDFNILNQLGSPSINSNTFANRPAAGQIGRLFVSTDTFEIYRDNGTTWDLIGGPGSSTITGTGTATQVAFFTSSQAIGSNANLYWDNINERLGIGTTTPDSKLDIAGNNTLLHLKGGSNAYMMYHDSGVDEYKVGYTGTGGPNYRRWSIYDESGAKEVITIDKQSRYVGINFQYSSLSDQPQYMLDLSGGSFHTNVGQYLVGTPTDLTRSFAASGNANDIAVWLEEYGNVTASADIFFIKGRGTDTAKLNVQVGDNLGGLIFTGYLNGQYNNSAQFTLVVTNLDTTNNQANADYVFLQSYNSVGFNENFRIIANGGDGYLRGKLGLGLTPTNDKLEVNGNVSIFGNKLYNGASSNSCGISLGGSAVRIDGFNGLTFAASAATVGSQTTRMFISSSTGNVIINNGSTDNGFALQVNGSITVSSELYLDNGAYVRFTRTSGNLSIQTLGILAGTDDVVLITTGDFYLRNGSAANLIKTTNAGNSEFLGNIKTGAPTTGTAATWKLGQRVAAAVVLDTTQYIEVDIGGTLYKLATVT